MESSTTTLDETQGNFTSDSSVLCHQEVLALHSVNELLFCGIGSHLYVYNANEELINRKEILSKERIFNIESYEFPEGPVLIVSGGKSFATCRLEGLEGEEAQCSDWIMAIGCWKGIIAIVTAHNEVQFWSHSPLCLFETHSTEMGPCILYSAALHVSATGGLYILAGTVFSEVLIWEAKMKNNGTPASIRRTLKGHKGVIFSITTKERQSEENVTICTTSDDRSTMLYSYDFTSDTLKQSPQMFGHTSRVWKSLLLSDKVLTVGEDGAIISWSYDGELIKRIPMHRGSIRSIAMKSSSEILTGSADGSIYSIPVQAFSKFHDRVTTFEVPGAPRKVVFLGGAGMAYLTDRNLFVGRSPGNLQEINHDLLTNCTDLKASQCGRCIAVSTTYGVVLLFILGVDEKYEVISRDVGKGSRCQGLFWHENNLLVQLCTGEMVLLNTLPLPSIEEMTRFILQHSRERSATCFVKIPYERLVIGDRCGNIHLYSMKETSPISTHRGVHSYLGVADVCIYEVNPLSVISVGSGGCVKITFITENSLVQGRTFFTPMESLVRIFNTSHGMTMAGYHGSSLQLWNVNLRMVTSQHVCGGGHRSYDFLPRKDGTVDFLYIKDKKIHEVVFRINNGIQIVRDSYHSKVINSMQVTVGGLVVSGGDDNAIKISSLEFNSIRVRHSLEHHISAVRCVKIHQRTEDEILIVSASGREQLSVSSCNPVTGHAHEITTHMPSGKDAAPVDSRFMCLWVKEEANSLLIFVGCSDRTLRAFRYEDARLCLISVTAYSHCILELLVIDNYVITFGTDGKAVFWNLENIVSGKSDQPEGHVILHQSGINSATIRKTLSDKHEEMYLLITGGDDNKLCLTSICGCTLDVREQHHYDSVHSCQITGLQLYKEWLITTSVDQRVILHRLHGTEAEKILESLVTVPDVHGLIVLSASVSQIKVCVYGSGTEVLEIGLPRT